MSSKKNNKDSGNDQLGQNVVKLDNLTESMDEIFDLNKPQTFSKEVKRSRITDAWGKNSKK